MAGPIKISFLADVGQAVKNVTHFSETVDSETKRVVTSLGDSKLEGGFGKVQEGFDVLDTRMMGFRDTITGVQDTMTGFQQLTLSTADAQAAYNQAVAEYGKDSDQAKAAQEALTNSQRSMADKLFTIGMGLGDLASGFANIIVPVLGTVTALTAQASAAGVSTGALMAQKIALVASTVTTGVMTAAQWALNTALSANPIGLVIVAIAALVAAVVIAYQRSATFRAIVNALGDSLKMAAQAVWDFVAKAARFIGDLPGKITGVFKNARDILANTGSAIMGGLWDGLVSGWGRVKDFLSQVTGWIPDWKGPRSKDKTLLTANGQDVMGGFLTGLESQYGTVRSSMAGFTDSLSGTVAGTIHGSVDVTGSAPVWAQHLEQLLAAGLTISLQSNGNRGDDALLDLIADRVRIKGGKGTVLGIIG